ncbi:MAG: GtrA family protein [Candidatus Falkowbacteria bacterium]
MMAQFIQKYFTVIKFLISGGLATGLDLVLLYQFTEVGKMWYFHASILAFLLAFIFSFLLQKYWTFDGTHARRKREQLPMHFILNTCNLGINSLGMFFLVDFVKIWYLFAQFILSGMIAVSNFYIYRYVIFKAKNESAMVPVDTV